MVLWPFTASPLSPSPSIFSERSFERPRVLHRDGGDSRVFPKGRAVSGPDELAFYSIFYLVETKLVFNGLLLNQPRSSLYILVK